MRAALRDAAESESAGHPALWISAYVGDLGSAEAKGDAVAKAAAWEPDAAYKAAYEAWKVAISDRHTHVEEMEAASPIIVGLAAETPLETAITLHYPYGVPIIPGSALKGLARSYARLVVSQREGGKGLAEGGEACKFLFGTQDRAGKVTFLDAWWVPRHGVQPLRQDMMTPHHMEYYSTKGAKSPVDTEDPVPVSFLHAEGRFLVALRCEDKAWREFAFRLLVEALADWGVGAKTAAGYGRLDLTPEAKWRAEAETRVDEAMIGRARQFNKDSVRGANFQAFLADLGKANEPTQREALGTVYPAVESAGLLGLRPRSKPQWVRDFEKWCERLGIGGKP